MDGTIAYSSFQTGPEYQLDIKVKNGYLRRLMELSGIGSAAELARATGLTNTEVGKILNLKVKGLLNNGRYRNSILVIARFFRVLPEDIYPDQHRDRALDTNQLSIDVSLDQIEQLSASHFSSNEATDGGKENMIDLIDEALTCLPPRQQKVLGKRFGLNGLTPATYKEIGNDFAVGGERIRQIEAKAIETMRNRIAQGMNDGT